MDMIKLVITVEFKPASDATPSDVEYLIDKAGSVISDEMYNTGLTEYCHYDTLRVLCSTSVTTASCTTHRKMTTRHAKT
jgi:hypothetical protein